MATTTTLSADIPIDVLESLLCDHLADQTALITECTITPFTHQGTNDSTSFFSVTLSWTLPELSTTSHAATWIVKRWQAGGARDSAMGLSVPREVLAWQQELLQPSAMPEGIVVPFIGARQSPDKTVAWIAMTDVSAELAAYPRVSLEGDQALCRAQLILARLAQFHVWWEQPERQARLKTLPWLRRPAEYLWDWAPTYAQALGYAPAAKIPAGSSAPEAWDGLAADLGAFLDWVPRDARQAWHDLLLDRSALVAALAPQPRTLLHNDLDDRNIGLRQPGGHATADGAGVERAELVLIDWEWMGVGPAATDVAKVVQGLPVVIAPGAPIPEACWTNELADAYFDCYRAAGGRHFDRAGWRRTYGIALVAQGMTPIPMIAGNMIRAVRGDVPPPQLPGIPEEMVRQHLSAGLALVECMVDMVTREARTWLR